MNIIKKFFFIFFFFIINSNFAESSDKIAFLDMEKVVKNSNIGKSVLSKINELNQNNIKILVAKEDKLKKIEESIKKKENILSKEELNKKINELKININNLRKEKDKMVKDVKEMKKQELKKLYVKINPIIQEYMDENNISILLDVNSIVFGKSNHNITTQLIDEINNKLTIIN